MRCAFGFSITVQASVMPFCCFAFFAFDSALRAALYGFDAHYVGACSMVLS
jgi:hypothetical protein